MSETNIVVVEDEASIAEVVSLFLKRAVYSVQVASDGKKAIDIFQKQKRDFVILDLMLPQMDGLSGRECRQGPHQNQRHWPDKRKPVR